MERFEHHERQRLRTAAFRAQRVYPGPVGELLYAEIMAWEEFGWRLGSKKQMMTLVDHIMKTSMPDKVAA
jgi:hypothetical protein